MKSGQGIGHFGHAGNDHVCVIKRPFFDWRRRAARTLTRYACCRKIAGFRLAEMPSRLYNLSVPESSNS